jgi:hypothetical protein
MKNASSSVDSIYYRNASSAFMEVRYASFHFTRSP